MKYFYDRKSDSLYLTLADRSPYRDSLEAAPGVVLDFDDRGRLIGIDLERASRLIDVSDLELHEEPSVIDAETASLDGAQLRQTREQLNLSQVELARKLSVSPNTVARWERGELKIEHAGMLQLALSSLQSATVHDASERGRQVGSTRSQAAHSATSVKNVHTVPRDGGWANVRSGNDRASSVHRTQAEAIDRGREMAQKTGGEHVIHGVNGRIRDTDSYGSDPHPPKDYREGGGQQGASKERGTERKSGRVSESRRAKKK
jgi:DNA-binding transcriptional regulator YiaG